MASQVPRGFHRLTNANMTGPFIKGHVYFNSVQGIIYLATGTGADDLEPFSSAVKDVTFNPARNIITITRNPTATNPTGVTRIDLSVFARAAALGPLEDLETEDKTDLVSAINEVLSIASAGGTGSAVTITEKSVAGFVKSYEFRQGSTLIGTVNIPKDMVVRSGTVEKNPEGQPQGTYLVLTLANAANDKVYINVGSLVDLYTAAQNAPQVQLAIDPDTREISASIVAGSIGSAELAANAVTSAKIASGAVTESKLSTALRELINGKLSPGDIAESTRAGHIAVKGTDVPVHGLGSAAFSDAADFITETRLVAAINSANQYADSLQGWATWEE